MTPETLWIDRRLERAYAYAYEPLKGLGLPRKTLLARVIEMGPMGASQCGPVTPQDEPKDVRETRRCIGMLLNIEQQVLLIEYTTYAPREVKARSVNMTDGRWKTVLHRSRRRVLDMLMGMGVDLSRD